jgi:chemotaxis methyl-accepting protein methylase
LSPPAVRVPDRDACRCCATWCPPRPGSFTTKSGLDQLRDRLSTLALERGFDSLLDYYYLLKYDASAAGEWPRVFDALSVQETYFWREVDQVRALVDGIVPRLLAAGRKTIRVWSVPCATVRSRCRWRSPSKKPAGSARAD